MELGNRDRISIYKRDVQIELVGEDLMVARLKRAQTLLDQIDELLRAPEDLSKLLLPGPLGSSPCTKEGACALRSDLGGDVVSGQVSSPSSA